MTDSVHVDPSDRGDGSGSRDESEDWLDAKSIYNNEWGSTAQTTFNPDDTDAKDKPISKSKKQRLKRQYKRHNGKGESDRKSTIRTSHVTNDTELFTDVLGLPESRASSVDSIIKEIDLEEVANGHYTYEKIILTTASLVEDKHLSEQSNADFQQRLRMTEEFKELMEVCKMSSKDHRQLRPKIRSRSSYFESSV